MTECGDMWREVSQRGNAGGGNDDGRKGGIAVVNR